jgi:hypothetical protein
MSGTIKARAKTKSCVIGLGFPVNHHSLSIRPDWDADMALLWREWISARMAGFGSDRRE